MVNQNAIGSRVYVETNDGKSQMQEVKSGSSFGSGNDLALHFGLGSSSIEAVRVKWSDGVFEQFSDVSSNQEWHLDYPTANIGITKGYTDTVLSDSIFTFTHVITNHGSRVDTINFEVEATHGVVGVSPMSVTLAPGEGTIVRVIGEVAAVGNVVARLSLKASSTVDPSISLMIQDTALVRPLNVFLPAIWNPG